MVKAIKKTIRMVGGSYGIILPKDWVEGLHLFAGCELDLYCTNTEIVLVPDWALVDGNRLGKQIEFFQKAKLLEFEDKILREERKELGNERLTRLQVAERIVNEEVEKDEGFQKWSDNHKKIRKELGRDLDEKAEDLKFIGHLPPIYEQEGWLKSLTPEELLNHRKRWAEMLEATKE